MLQTLSYIINVAPEGVPQVVRLSQNENGRTLSFTLTGAGTVNIPSGSTVTISGTKPDGVVYSQTGTISGTTASFPETTQMTAVSGIWPAKIKVTYNGETIATCKIVMAIDPDPVAPGSVPSSSQLNGLVAEAQQYATYAKYEAFGSPLVAATAAAMTDKTRVYVYTGSETGKTAGHWYYWNGSAWTDGGVYNSQGINTDTTLTLSGMAADAKATGDQFTLVKQDNNGNYYCAARVKNSSVNKDTGAIISPDSGYTRTDYIPITDHVIIIDVASPQNGSSIYNCFYDADKNFISSFRVWGQNPYETGITGYRNIITVPANAKYAILSGTNAFMANVGIRNTSCRKDWTWVIASSDSVCANEADVVAYGTKDDANVINKFMANHCTDNDVFYIAPDSTFTLRSPIEPYSNTTIRSNGAKFTQPNMVIENISQNVSQGATTLYVSDVTEFSYISMWVYIEDSSGNYESNYITNYDGTTNKLTLKYPTKHAYLTTDSPVIKSANSCFLFVPDTENVEIDGVVIDWNVSNNPQQTYNPDYVQDGFSLNQAKNIRIKNCTILNGGRRGICGYDATNVLVEDCFIDNWSEHGIDWYCSTGSNGNTPTLPKLIDAKVINTTCCNNTLCGIQNHRGSGVSIVGCIVYGNAHGIRMQEYAHDVTVSGCVIRDNTGTGVNILTNSNKLNLTGNIITRNASDGVQFVNANRLLVSNNQISNNGQRGVYLENTHKCEIACNHISNNNLDTPSGENNWYFAGVSLVNSTYNKVTNNYCAKEDGEMKFGVYERSTSNYNVINSNYIIGSTNGVYTTGTNTINRDNDLFS